MSFFYKNHLIRKCFGQHFLHDRHIINSIISSINPKSDQVIVEIGPGLGALTELMLKYVSYMTIIEYDSNLVDRLNNNIFFKYKLNIIKKNAMIVNFSELSDKFNQSLRIFGNLPYNISIPIIFHLFTHINVIHDMHFMFQKEVADRLTAIPNSKKYGRLSVIAQYYCKIVKILEVSPFSFIPKPKVNSSMVRLIPYSIIPLQVYDINKLITLTNLAFNQRRKMLRNSLSIFFTEQQLLEQGIDSTLRAENLDAKNYYKLANILTKRFKNIK